MPGTSYLFECGVLGTFILTWVLPQPSLSKRNRLHTFFFVPAERSRGNNLFKMKCIDKNGYESPAVEVLEIEAEQCFAGSGDGEGTGNDWPGFGSGNVYGSSIV